MAERFKLRRKRIGSSQQHQPANRVNKFLSQAIDARSVDQEKAHNVNMFSLCFRDPEKERQVKLKSCLKIAFVFFIVIVVSVFDYSIKKIWIWDFPEALSVLYYYCF